MLVAFHVVCIPREAAQGGSPGGLLSQRVGQPFQKLWQVPASPFALSPQQLLQQGTLNLVADLPRLRDLMGRCLINHQRDTELPALLHPWQRSHPKAE